MVVQSLSEAPVHGHFASPYRGCNMLTVSVLVAIKIEMFIIIAERHCQQWFVFFTSFFFKLRGYTKKSFLFDLKKFFWTLFLLKYDFTLT